MFDTGPSVGCGRRLSLALGLGVVRLEQVIIALLLVLCILIVIKKK
jgi:hypothetical protein